MTTNDTRSPDYDAGQMRVERVPGFTRMETFVVFTLDDGAEIRVRHMGDRVEVRTWDATRSCRPPRLDVKQVGAHVIDVRPLPPGSGVSDA